MFARTCVIGVLLTVTATAQDRPLFSTRSQLVLVHATVKDGRGGYVGGLTQNRFLVYDNNRPQPIRFFLDEDAPVTIGLLVDNSGSMRPNRELVIAAASSFVETSHSRDEIFALAFDDEVRPVLPASQPFTSDPVVLRSALQRAITARGQTSLYDAIARGLDYAEAGSHTRKVLVVVSDGSDNASESTFGAIVPKLQASNIVLYAIAMEDSLLSDGKPRRLKELASATGGEVFSPRHPKAVHAAFQQIARDIRHAYVVAFEPDESLGGGLHRIRLVVSDPQRRRLSVRTRTGYLGGVE
jgi:VWFA-related protein